MLMQKNNLQLPVLISIKCIVRIAKYNGIRDEKTLPISFVFDVKADMKQIVFSSIL